MRKFWTILSGTLTIVFLTGSGGQEPKVQTASTQTSFIPGSAALKVDRDFGKMPLYFIPNQGQMDARVAYYLQGKDKTIYFTSEGLTYVLSERSAGEEIAEKTASVKERLSINPAEHELRSRRDQRRFAVKLDFVGANADVRPSGEEKTGAVISYFKGKPEEWKAGLPTYSRIVYKNLWPGIDVAYYGTVDKMKYEFVVHPGSDPSLIRLAYRGASAVELNGEGRLKVRTPAGGFEDDRPVGYQEINGDRVDVAMSYLLEEQSAKDAGPGGQEAVTKSYVYGFEVGDYDRTKPLVLDPAVLFYCGYIGGSLGDGGAGIAVDSMGNAYITGSTSSTEATFPVFGGPDLTNNGNGDAFVAKVNASGTALVYCGYIGGSDYDRGFAIAVDGSGNAYVTGRTWSAETTFPVIGGPDLTHNGGEDAFVAKVNASGTALVYCGYVGGGDWDEGYGIAVDGSGNVYVAGYTESTEATFPAIGGPDLTYNGGRFDAFVAKVNASGTALVYCGYIGGSGDDWGYAIAVDGSGNAYITGFTNSTQATFPVIGGLDLTHNGGEDAFVAKVNASGTALVYCGYIGGGDWDEGYGIAVDGSGNAYVAGNTSSTEATFPVLYGPDLTQNGSYDAFVAKVNASGTALVYCGYIGGSDWDEGYGIAVDGSGNAYVTGRTWSAETTFPVIGGPDLTFNGNDDAFVAKVNASGAALVYCGYIGGSLNDMGYGIAVDSTGNAYATGSTFSTAASFPVIGGPDLTYNGYSDAFVAKISPHKPELTIQSSQYGTTNPSPGVYYYATGTRVQVTAIPNTNCEFVNWSGDISSTQNPVTVTMNGNKTIEANFRLQPKLTIQSSANGTTDPVPGVYAYPLNVVVQVTAVPATYSDFISWTGDATGAANPVSVTMNRDKSILANFRYIYAPTASGVKVLNRSFSQAEYINILSWEAIPANAGLDITKYKIYLVNNGTPSLLAEVGADQRQYSHRKAGQQKLDYAIVAVLSSGREGAPVLVTVQ